MGKREVEINRTITLGSKFYYNGNLIDPYNISSVQILSAPSNGSLLATLPLPIRVSQGIWETTWTVPSSSSIGLLYDQWTWQANISMPTTTSTYSFRVLSAPDTAKPVPSHGPLFVGHQEVNFFNSITKELIQRIVSQKIIYYSVSDKHTKSHPIYDEAVKKTVYTPVEVNALVMFEEPTQTANRFTIDTVYDIEVYFHQHELEERSVIPRVGDFVKFGNIVYEIQKLNSPQLVYGQVNHPVMIKCNCHVSRKSQFQVLDTIPGYNTT